MKALLKRIISIISQMTEYHDLHPVRAMKVAACEQTVQYIEARMPHAVGFYHDDDILDYAVKSAKVTGCFLEFGVFKGRSLCRIANEIGAQQTVHGFDSFEGLPEAWGGTFLPARSFSVGGKLPKVPANVVLHKGLFDKTVPAWLIDHSESVSFMHIDCDLYSSTKSVLELLGSRLQCGTIILFDEYFNYPNWRNHEFRAFQEFVSDSKLEYEYIGYSWAQAAVKVTKVSPQTDSR